MQGDENDVEIGPGGWVLVVVAGVSTLAVLHYALAYDFFPSAVFALAIALMVVLVLYRLAAAINRMDEEEAASQRVRKIVPAATPAEGAAVTAVRVVPTRPTASSVVPSAVVTPLSEVESAPLIAPPPVAAPVAAPAPVVEAPKVAAEPVVAKTAKTAPAKAKAAPKPKAEAKPKASAKAKAAEKPAPKAKAASGAKPKAEGEKAAATGSATKSGTAKAAAKAKAPGPERLSAPRNGRPDDLKEIEGIGPALEKLVNGLGFYHFDQIANWSEADVALVDAEMKTFKGRITRDNWVAQAKIIVTDGLEAFRERAKTNNY
ncbi:MAG: hypothetical protein JNK19_16175 [Tabrizicola sp.]|nr:hypothetical protein [Tabrizicola sp.]